jgi:hypothetical protein
VYIYTNSKLVY